jgi:hypothetical protein
MNNAAALITVIAATAAALVTVINAVAAGWGRTEAREAATSASAKLDQIHELTNSNMTALKAQLAAALDRINALEERLISHGATGQPPT